MSKELKPKEDQYTNYLFLGDSQRVAFRKAFPHSIKWKDETVDSKACKLAKTDKVKARLAELRIEMAENVAESTLLSAENVLSKINDLILRNEGEDDKTALKGLELYGKHLKLFTDKVEHSGEMTIKNKYEKMTDEELDKELAQYD